MNLNVIATRGSITFVLLAFYALVGASTPIFGAKTEGGFGEVVKLIESHYGAKQVRVSKAARLGAAMAKTGAKVVSRKARQYLRYGDFKLAVFEDQDFSADSIAFHRRMREAVEPGWLPLVVVRVPGESQVFTYTKEEGGKFKVLVIVLEQRDGVVVQVDLNTREMLKLLRDPADESRVIADEAAADEQ